MLVVVSRVVGVSHRRLRKQLDELAGGLHLCRHADCQCVSGGLHIKEYAPLDATALVELENLATLGPGQKAYLWMRKALVRI